MADAVEKILFDHFYTGEPGQHEAIKAAAKMLVARQAASHGSAGGEASEVRTDDAKRITGAVLSTLKAGGDNLAIYQAVLGALPVAQARPDPFMDDYKRDILRGVREITIEECAKIADGNRHSSIMPGHVGKNIAAEIRALSVPSAEGNSRG